MHLSKERIQAKIALADNGCWEWTGAKYWTGYGHIIADKVHYAAHRASYMLYIGDIPDGMVVCHKCDNPPCVNPAHLFLGTKADNSSDMVRKARSARGEKNAKAKLTEDQVREVLRLRKSGLTLQALADRFKVTKKAVHFIITGKNWKHLQEAA